MRIVVSYLLSIAAIAPFASITALEVTGQSSHFVSEVRAVESSTNCGCSRADSKGRSSGEKSIANGVAPISACEAGYERYCTKTSETRRDWCVAGGIWSTCETPSTDNDGDGVLGEAHFARHRYEEHWRCDTGNFTRCGASEPTKIGVGSDQDKCCATLSPEPACPAGSCQ